MKRCPVCQKEFADKAKHCVFDGSKLQPLPPANAPATTAPAFRCAGRRTLFLQGQVIAGRYRLLAKLADNGLGTVFKSESAALCRPVALNLFPSELSQDRAFVAEFQREAQAALRLHHPHVAAIYDFGTTRDGHAYLVSELVEDESLASLLRREGPLPLSRAFPIARQVAEAVGAAHKAGMIHGSLKSDRVVVGRTALLPVYAKVLGFGMFRLMPGVAGDRLTAAGVVTAAPEYMAPEQLRGEQVDARCDIYSLATLVYEMLSGRLPFAGASPQLRAVRKLAGEPTPLRTIAPQVGQQVDAVVMRGLARRPEDRHATIGEFTRELEAAARAEAIDQLDGIDRPTARQPVATHLSALLNLPETCSSSLLAAAPQAQAMGLLKRRAATFLTSVGRLFILTIVLGLMAVALVGAALNLAALIVLALAVAVWVRAVMVMVHRHRQAPPSRDMTAATQAAQPQEVAPNPPVAQEAPSAAVVVDEATERQPAERASGKWCSTCGSTLLEAARFCVRDGTPVRQGHSLHCFQKNYRDKKGDPLWVALSG